MSTDATSELASFYQFVGHALERGETNLSPEELLAQWRNDHPLSEDALAVLEALRDMAAGERGIPLDEYERRVLASRGELPDEWPAMDSDDEQAIQEALDSLEAGEEGIPFEEFDRQFRARHGIPNDF